MVRILCPFVVLIGISLFLIVGGLWFRLLGQIVESVNFF